MNRLLILATCLALIAPSVMAQSLNIVTVTRPPFSMEEQGAETGFSIELWRKLADDIGREYTIERVDSFSEMLDRVRNGQVDAAVANISITAIRETEMDFSQPIFESGLQIMVQQNESAGFSVFRAIFSRDVMAAIALAFALLFGAGMLMWRFERKSQEYFDLSTKQAMFPSFWWALNLMLNGGFEERVPRTALGRLFGVILVISSLFFVSIFVAKITSVLTVEAIQGNVNQISDLYGKKVATITDSTSSKFLDNRDIRYVGFESLDELLVEFEAGSVAAVVFDAPILAYYAKNSSGDTQLAGAIFQRENYGIALPSGSDLAEPLNQSLLKLRENGSYDALYREWFGINANR
ncbi:MAG: transporter substrate-binding domain-containing protein [Marinosulfonomonas sp.]|nr:transporter substrate-binding domain-containing protein [Marinosulfonomonas sp.]